MVTPRISVVIPCYNNASLLPVTLSALTQQTLPLDQFEVVIIDDGSTDATQDIITALKLPPSFRYIRRGNQGAAAARNYGAFQAGGEILLFLDSDVVPDSTLLHAHLESHGLYKRALVVGRTRTLPAKESDFFYKLLGDEVFSFDEGDEEKQLTFQQVLTRNLSMRREAFFEISRFDEEFPRSGYEDIEFAYRATQRGFSLIYNPGAAGDHHHTGTLTEVGQHMYNYQISAALFIKKHPEIRGQIRHLQDKEPIHWKQDGLKRVTRKLMRQVVSLPLTVWLMKRTIAALEKWYPSPALLRFIYWQVLGSYLFWGFRQGLKHYQSH